MTSSAPAQGDASHSVLTDLGDLGDLGLSLGADPSTQQEHSAHGTALDGTDGAPNFDHAAAMADSNAAAVETLTSHATNFPAFDNNLTTDDHAVAALNTTTTSDVSATRIPSEPLQQQTLDPPAPIPLPNPGGDAYLSDVDVDVDALPPGDDLDSVMVDAPDRSAESIPAEPVTPIQSQPHSRHLSRRSSAADRNAIPFASASEASRIRNVISSNFNMMNFAQMSSPHPMGMSHVPQTPTVVTPAQVTLPNNLAAADGGLEGDTYPFPTVEEDLESFARIEFADSVFQMTTYAVIIGRDQRAMDQAKRDERRAEEFRRVAEERANMGLPPPSPEMHDRNRKFSKSYVSEEGGMLGPESDGESATRPQKKRKRTRSINSSQNEPEQPEEQLIMDRQYVSHTPGAAAVDLLSLRPSPHHTPFIGIHSPGPDIASKTKAISREHLKIEFNVKKNAFEAIPLHKNGFFCDDVHYRQESVVLRSGARLQIKDVDFTFIINGVIRGHTGAEDLEDGPSKLARRYAEGGKEMSVDFELGQNCEEMMSDSDELSELEESPAELSDDAEGELKSDSEAEAEEGTTVIPDPLPEQPPKRRGPGRPPKDGIMSKRERRELAKLEQELERQRQLEAQATAGSSAALAEHLPTGDPGDIPLKRKVGRPRKHPLPEGADGKPEKRKYKPRKPKEEEGSEAERRRERKERRLARPKSPPLRLRREDFTEEQLAKPNKNYGILIDEVLREAGEEGLILKQIYNRIAAKYPFYHFCTETKGWESSVRHNLIGNSAFSKDPKSGAWTRVPGIELDAGKKRKGDSAAAERAAAAAATAAAAALGGSPFGGSYGGTPYPGYGAGHQVPPGTPQGYSQGGVQGYQQSQQAGYGVQPGQAYAGQPGQQEQSPQHSTPSGATPRSTHMPPPAQQANGPSPPVANGATAGQPRHPSGTPQPNGPAPAMANQQGFYGALQAASQPQANGPAPRQTLAPRPAVLHPQLLASLARFAREMHKHPELDRRWIFSALNRVLGLKPGFEAPQGGRDLAEGLERKLVRGMETVAGRYFETRAGKETGGKEVLHPELVALFVEFRGNFQRGSAGKEREMGEFMMLSCFDRVVGVREGSVFEGLKEEGVLEEAEARRWGAAEGELVEVVKGYVTGMGFTL